jgi:probable phosphomutase (TIGR03848 family)
MSAFNKLRRSVACLSPYKELTSSANIASSRALSRNDKDATAHGRAECDSMRVLMPDLVTVFLIRHGTTARVGKGLTGWLPGHSLDENGRKQADELASRLANAPFTAIYSSPLERACETAAPLARRLGLEVRIREEFGEVRFGDWQGKDFIEIERDPRWSPFNSYRSFTRAPGGEMMLQTQARMVRGLLDLVEAHANETVAVFSHADAIKSALMHFLGIPLDFHIRLEILPASVSVIEFFPELPLVKVVNATDFSA